MDKHTENARQQSEGSAEYSGERLVYVVPPDALIGSQQEGLDLLGLWALIWTGRWLVAAITGACIMAAAAYALLATEWYRAEVVLAPADEGALTGIPGQLGGLAALAGISVRGRDSNESLAMLTSKGLTRAFIEEQDLLPVLFADDWDHEASRWRSADRSKWPDVRDAVRYFDENVRSVSEDRSTGIITLAVDWTDPELAAKWANLLVAYVNDRMRRRALAEAESNVSYLKDALGETSVIALQETIGRLLETELQKLMLARGNEQFAFRVIDEAVPPKERVRPRRVLLVLAAAVFGGVASLLVLLILQTVRRTRPDGNGGDERWRSAPAPRNA